MNRLDAWEALEPLLNKGQRIQAGVAVHSLVLDRYKGDDGFTENTRRCLENHLSSELMKVATITVEEPSYHNRMEQITRAEAVVFSADEWRNFKDGIMQLLMNKPEYN